MKKKLLTFILVGTMLTAASVIGCGKSAQDAQTSANTETKADTETAAEDNADSETGSVQINGGIENDGIDLMERYKNRLERIPLGRLRVRIT